MIWSHFGEHHAWPTFEDIDRRLYAATGVEFETAVRQLCPALLRGLDPDFSHIPQNAQKLSLTIAGAANCTGAGPAISAFLAMVRTAATIEPHFRPTKPDEQPVLMPVDVRSEPGTDPKVLTKQIMFAAAALGLHEPCFRGGGSNADGLEWSLHYDRSVRPFDSVGGLADYWQVRKRVMGPERTEADSRPFSNKSPERVAVVSPLLALTATALGASEPTAALHAAEAPDTMAVSCELHPLIAEVAVERFNDGHYLDAVVHAFKAVEYRVQTFVGSHEIGAKLMGIAVGSTSPRITVTRATGPSLQGEQEGMRDLFKGAMTALRNPRAHGPHFQDDPDEAQEMLVIASFLMRRLDIEDGKRKSAASGD